MKKQKEKQSPSRTVEVILGITVKASLVWTLVLGGCVLWRMMLAEGALVKDITTIIVFVVAPILAFCCVAIITARAVDCGRHTPEECSALARIYSDASDDIELDLKVKSSVGWYACALAKVLPRGHHTINIYLQVDGKQELVSAPITVPVDVLNNENEQLVMVASLIELRLLQVLDQFRQIKIAALDNAITEANANGEVLLYDEPQLEIQHIQPFSSRERHNRRQTTGVW